MRKLFTSAVAVSFGAAALWGMAFVGIGDATAQPAATVPSVSPTPLASDFDDQPADAPTQCKKEGGSVTCTARINLVMPGGVKGGGRRQFMILFDFSDCRITDRWDRELSQTAAAIKSQGIQSVRIVGHTDTAEMNNLKLSECRANAAKSDLIGRGVLGQMVTASGAGKSDPMVDSGEGKIEPRNRRAEIELK